MTTGLTNIEGITATGATVGGTFDSGTITNTPIGSPTPSTGNFTTVTVASGAVGAPSITFSGTPTTGIWSLTANQIDFATAGASRACIKAGGIICVGSDDFNTTTFASTSANGALMQGQAIIQENGTSDVGAMLGVARYVAGAAGPSLNFAKSRSGTVSIQTVVVSGDSLGAVNFGGGDGTAQRLGAQILCQVDNSAGTNSMPASIFLKTTPLNSVTPTAAVTIDSTQTMTIVTGSGGLNFGTVVSGQGAQAATLLTSPIAGNPSFWIPVRVNGVIRFIPSW